ncbi:MAG: thiamine diphosphokinase [Deltaproteobacteria bacterium]
MKCLLLANGEYGDLDAYQKVVPGIGCIICADGGANYAYRLGLSPDYIVGDMDSISPDIADHYAGNGVLIKKYPRSKDFTDTQLAFSLAQEIGAREILTLGLLGGRLDHTLSNLYAGVEAVEHGIKVAHFTPDCMVYLLKGKMTLFGQKGDLVSVMAVTERAAGVYETGFEYPLDNVILEMRNPFAVSNVMAADLAEICAQSGILAVFHYRS